MGLATIKYKSKIRHIFRWAGHGHPFRFAVLLAAALFLVQPLGCKKEEGAKSEEGQKGGKAESPVYPLEPFVVNLADSEDRYLRVAVSLELTTGITAEGFKQSESKVRDVVLTLLSSKYYSDIRSAEGKVRLRSEIVNNINSALKKKYVNTAYFTEFIAQ